MIENGLKGKCFCHDYGIGILSRVDKIHDVDKEHQPNEQEHGNAVDHVFPFGGDAFAEEDFGKGEENAAAIERGDGKKIHHAERNAEYADQVEGPVGGLGALALAVRWQLPDGWKHPPPRPHRTYRRCL